MYSELALIKPIPDLQTQLKLTLLFIEEYGGWKQHLESAGIGWGSGGEAVGAAKEHKKCVEHLADLHAFAVSLSENI